MKQADTTTLIAIAAAIPFVTASAQDLGVKAPAQDHWIEITGATIHPVSGPVIENGRIAFYGGKIALIEKIDASKPGVQPPPGLESIDGRGKHVYPGMIAAYSQIGLREIESLRPSTDINEAGAVTPEARAAMAVNPDSWLFPVTRANGVLLAGTFPASGTIPGRAGVVRLDGWTVEEMTVKNDAGVVVEWPLMRVVRSPFFERSDEDQLKGIRDGLERIREAFKSAAAYAGAPQVKTDLRWEAMRAVFPGSGDKARAQLPVYVLANDYDQIVAAVELKRQHKLKMVIVGGLDAPRCGQLLSDEGVAVIVTNVIVPPRRDDSAYDENYTLPARLAKVGVRFCIASGDETPHERNLPYAAAMAAAHGLSPDDAIRSVTLSAAEILGVADQYGSLDKDKSATLLITDGNPLEVGTVIERAYIDGRRIDLSTKQSVLAEKYRERYRQMLLQQKKALGPDNGENRK